MPRAPLHALIWSPDQGLYELSTGGRVVRRFRAGDDDAWLTWLGTVTSFAFHRPAGSLNVYLEARPRGGQYWYAYHTDSSRTRKRYLGRTERVSLARLEATARALAHADEQTRSPMPPPSSSRVTETEPDLLPVTKLAPPHLPTALVERGRLLSALEGALSTPLTLVSASAGWGKTTLLASWSRRYEHQVAWLSLEAQDNELTRFWTAVIAALRTNAPGIGTVALGMLRAQQPPPFSAILTALINDLTQGDEGSQQRTPLLLVLDDYHVIDEPAIHESMTYLAEHLPAHVHLLLASRVDPDLPLARWRARGHLLELRAADLHFRLEEAVSFLQQTMGLGLSEDEVAALQRRTEGWVAGLQLTALSLRQQEDPSAWIATLTGSQRYLFDYVQEEILQRQPQPVRNFLVQVAILTRLNAALCRAVTGDPESQAILETLERSNLFVVPLDEHRQWYRLHDLFREALLARLQTTQPDLLPQLHLRAARWHEAVGELREAIVHAQAASDSAYAVRLIERAAPRLWLSGEAQTVHAWLAALPDAVLWQHAPLALNAMLRVLESLHGTAEASYARGRAQVEQTMARLAALLHQQAKGAGRDEGVTTPPGELPVIARRLRLLRALIEAETCLQDRDKARLARLAREIEGLSPNEEMRWQMIALAIEFWLTEGFNREGALLLPRLLEVRQQAERTGAPPASVRAQEWLAFAYARAAQWPQVERECQAGLALLDHRGARTAWAGYLHYFLAEAYYAWDRLDRADDATQQMLYIGQEWQQVDLLTAGQLCLARNRLARGDLADADQALQQAETLVQQERIARGHPVIVGRIQYWLATGELEAASQWAERAAFPPDPATWDPNDKWAVLMLVRVQLTLQQVNQALETLERFRTLLDRPGDIYNTVRFLALRIVALHQAGKRAQAQSVLTHLLGLAEPTGEIRVYLDAGEPMRQVLAACLAPTSSQHKPASASAAYVSRLLAAFEHEQHGAGRSSVVPTRAPRSAPAQVSPIAVTSLTRREQEVLRLLADGASNQEIAQTLVISLDTAKKHVSNLLGKLGATSRTQAVAQARVRSLL